MNKSALIKKIVEHLSAELALYHKAARATHAEATHEQSKPENKYDTRGLEASYLARGQSRQAAEILDRHGAIDVEQESQGLDRDRPCQARALGRAMRTRADRRNVRRARDGRPAGM